MTSRTRFLLLAVLAGWATTTQAQVPAAKAAPGAPPASSATPVPSADPVGTAPGEAWGSAHWNMTPEEVLSAFPKAFRLEPEVRLEDGNTVTVGIDGHSFEGLAFRVRFIFAKGKLALVSLRTDPAKYVDAPAYEKLR